MTTKPPRLIIRGCQHCGGTLARQLDDILKVWEMVCLNCGRTHNPPEPLPLVIRERAASMKRY